MEILIDYQVHLINFPTGKTKEAVTENEDGSYTIFIEEKLSKDLEETKTKLSQTEGKLEQVTSMYKEQFSSSSKETQDEEPKKKLVFDVMDALTEIRS